MLGVNARRFADYMAHRHVSLNSLQTLADYFNETVQQAIKPASKGISFGETEDDKDKKQTGDPVKLAARRAIEEHEERKQAKELELGYGYE